MPNKSQKAVEEAWKNFEDAHKLLYQSEQEFHKMTSKLRSEKVITMTMMPQIEIVTKLIEMGRCCQASLQEPE
ncbi:unnamed protein product [Ilex paraguariensis]|uniref:Uncharacterized protein n=1 Tax=Ilex paraguariensis TaxID=185542 RepID=A0ABC8SN24_9AQUA